MRGGYYGRYVPSGLASPKRGEREGGHLIYMQQGTLFAVRFDLDRLETIGQAVPVFQASPRIVRHRRRATGVLVGRHAGVRARRGRDAAERRSTG